MSVGATPTSRPKAVIRDVGVAPTSCPTFTVNIAARQYESQEPPVASIGRIHSGPKASAIEIVSFSLKAMRAKLKGHPLIKAGYSQSIWLSSTLSDSQMNPSFRQGLPDPLERVANPGSMDGSKPAIHGTGCPLPCGHDGDF